MPDFARLADNMEMWTYLGFEPWRHSGKGLFAMEGLSRKITMIKSSLLGPVAKYYAWDYIVWKHRGDEDVQYVMKDWKPMPDVMTQRFLFIGVPSRKRRAKGFWLGFKGFLEIYSYIPGEAPHPKVKDLIPPVDLAWKDDKNFPK